MHHTSELGMLKLTVGPRRDPEYIRLAVEQIQGMPSVVRVRADQTASQIEVMFRQPVNSLLQSIPVALRMAGSKTGC